MDDHEHHGEDSKARAEHSAENPEAHTTHGNGASFLKKFWMVFALTLPGAHLASNFHVIGETFDTVYLEAALRDTISNVQTTSVPAGAPQSSSSTSTIPITTRS